MARIKAELEEAVQARKGNAENKLLMVQEGSRLVAELQRAKAENAALQGRLAVGAPDRGE